MEPTSHTPNFEHQPANLTEAIIGRPLTDDEERHRYVNHETSDLKGCLEIARSDHRTEILADEQEQQLGFQAIVRCPDGITLTIFQPKEE